MAYWIEPIALLWQYHFCSSFSEAEFILECKVFFSSMSCMRSFVFEVKKRNCAYKRAIKLGEKLLNVQV